MYACMYVCMYACIHVCMYKNKFSWFVLHAEAESGVVQGFKVQGAIEPDGPTVAGGSETITLAVVRARSKSTYASTDDTEEEELLGTHVHGWGQAFFATDQRTYITEGHFLNGFQNGRLVCP